jgi:hypothetical protein
MAKGALYWRLKDEQTGKWTYKKALYIQLPDGTLELLPLEEM